MKTPRNTTHVRLDTDGKRSSMMTVKDMDCIAGVAGTVTFLQQLHGKDKYKELKNKLLVDKKTQILKSGFEDEINKYSYNWKKGGQFANNSTIDNPK